MLRADKTVTIINVWHSRTAGSDQYALHTVSGCSWRTEAASPPDNTGRGCTLSCKVRIPYDDGYKPYSAYLDLSSSGRESVWTLGGQTWLYEGALNTMDATTFADLCKRRALFRVSVWHENRDGIHPHLYTEGGA